jgi:hypothetical protein
MAAPTAMVRIGRSREPVQQWDEWVSADIDYIQACPGLAVLANPGPG